MPVPDARVHLVIGKDEFLKREHVRSVRAALFPKGADASLNAADFYSPDDAFSEAASFLQTMPFLAERRLAVIHDADAMPDPERDELLAFVKRMPSTAVIVLTSAEGSAAKDPFLRALSEHAKTIMCHAPFERDLPGWAARRAVEAGVKLDAGAVALVVERAGRDTASIAAAVEQLAVYAGEKKTASRADAERLLGKSVQADVFELSDRVIARDAFGAAKVLRALFEEGTKAVEVVSVLAGQFERVAKARALLDAGKAPRDAAAELRVHPFFADKLARQAQSAPAARISAARRLLLDCDEGIKTGRLPDRLALERAVMELCA